MSVPRPLPATAGTVFAAFLAALLLLAAPAATAQPDFLLGARAGYADLSGGLYDDVYDGGVTPLGLQAEVRWPAFLLRLAVERAEADGQLFIPLTPLPGTPPLAGSNVDLTLDLYHLTAAYNADAGGGAWSWFAGGGASYAEAEEESSRFRRDESSGGFHAVAGARRALGPRWELAGEAMYYTVSDLLEQAGTGSDDLEGLAVGVSLAFRF